MTSYDEDNFILDFTELENEINELCDKGELQEMLQLQLSEIEMLQSMFSNPGEFVVDDYGVLADVNDFVCEKTSQIPPHVDFQIKLMIDNVRYQLHVYFPHEYPACEPDIFVRNDTFTRYQQNQINKELERYVNTLTRGEICVYHVINWLQDNASNYVTQQPESSVLEPEPSLPVKDEFSRYWIYSHHIYSKDKRREMLSLANDYNITGFVLPGRPGVICIEGAAPDCAEWWQRVKALTWKKIVCRKKEVYPGVTNMSKERKFESFKEIAFHSQNLTSKHMDMGELFKFLEQHDCAYAFKDYFGLDGKSS